MHLSKLPIPRFDFRLCFGFDVFAAHTSFIFNMFAKELGLVNQNFKVNVKKLTEFIKNENKFITDLFAVSNIPDRKYTDTNDVLTNGGTTKDPFGFQGKKPSRARSMLELHQRLKEVNKKKLNYKEKLEKKKIKNRLKKKTKKESRNIKQKMIKAAKSSVQDSKVNIEPNEDKSEEQKIIYNKDDKIVYSKFNFADLGKKQKVRQEKDPKQLLKRLEQQEKKIKELKSIGEINKAVEIQEKSAWKNALAKSEGQKVKDNPQLLIKSVRRKEEKQRSSKKKWEQRLINVQKAKDERQEKRTQNIQNRKKEKKNKKLKNAVKRGKIIPGF